jgi:hypothetical protein
MQILHVVNFSGCIQQNSMIDKLKQGAPKING